MLIRTAALTDIGKVREENEDRFLRDDELRLYAVADGIGGLAGGAQAAEETVSRLHELVRATPEGADCDLAALVPAINERVAELGRTIDPNFGIGTTLVAGRIIGEQLRLIHIGDSVCYLIRAGALQKITEDHTVENEIKAKHGHAAMLFLNPRTRNALTRCIGQQGSPVPDVITRDLAAGDRILLCSDGISRFIPEDEIADVIAQATDPAQAMRSLIVFADSRGGIDNATGVAIFVDEV